ncbi:hypothetical protein SSX86_006641 [Deinandra increscens subsp. villosa]|uniref:BED-type domain-containing protein n=1 Tax=Deinandra increscens subsp. villosa TaxID=3103831 RepID=A0AAP0DJ38_9ASTR
MATQEEIEHISSDEPQEKQGQKRKTTRVAKKPVKKKQTGKENATGSKWWQYYDKYIDEGTGLRRARCKYCPQTLAAESYTNGTSGLKRHAHACEHNPDFKMKDQAKIQVTKNDGDEGGPSEVKTWKFSAENTRKAIAKKIILDELPFSSVEHEGFKNLMETVCPNFKVPSRHTIARDCGELFLEEKAVLKSYFGNSKTRVCLTTDTWTSLQRINYMCLTAHFIDENWVYHKRIINFKPIHSHKGDAIGRSLQKCLEEWDINNVLTITTDNASSNDTAMTYLRGNLDNLILEGRYLHVRCMAHIVNLIVKDGLSSREGAIERIRNAIRYIRISPKRLQQFRECAEKKEIKSKAMLCLDCPTRWNSTYEMLSRAEKFEAAFKSYDRDEPKFREDLDNEIPTTSDWESAREINQILELFKQKTIYASASTYVNVHQYVREVMGVVKKVKEMQKSNFYINKEIGNLMDAKINKYWGEDKFENKLLYFATILDPRSKTRMIHVVYKEVLMVDKQAQEKEKDIEEKVQVIVNKIVDALQAVYREYELDHELESTSTSSNVEHSSQMPLDGEDEFVAKFKCGGSSSYKAKSELEKYLDDDEEKWDNSFDVLKWWKSNASRYPIVSRMAKDILAIPVSSVASESAFSTGGRVIDAYRSSLSPPVVEALICTQDWIRKSNKAIKDAEDPTDFDELGNGKKKLY